MQKPENAKWCIQCLPSWRKLIPKFYFAKRYLLYAWVRKEAWLYIGVSSNLYYRLGHHDIIGKQEPITEDDTLYIWLADNELAHKTERSMIRRYRPKYNRR